MIRAGQTFTDRQGETWRVVKVFRRHVEAEHIDGQKPSGITARFKRGEVER